MRDGRVHKKEETKREHAIRLYPCKTIYLDILTKHIHLITPQICYLLFTFLSPHPVYIYINPFKFLLSHLKMMSRRHRNVVFFPLIISLKCLTKFNLIRILKRILS